MTQPSGPIAAANQEPAGPQVRLEPKDLLIQAIAGDIQHMQAGQPGRVSAIDVREILLPEGAKGANPRKNLPDRLELGVPREVLLSVRPQDGTPPSQRKEPKVYVLLVTIPADVVGEIARKATSRIITPEQARMIGGARR